MEIPHNKRTVPSEEYIPNEPKRNKLDNLDLGRTSKSTKLEEFQQQQINPLIEESYDAALTPKENEFINGVKNESATLDFFPSKKQLLFFKHALQADNYEITAIAEAAGMNRNAWYQWIQDPNFVKWYNTMWQRALDSNAWKLDIMGLKQAKNNFKYWKAMQQRSGRLLDTSDRSTSVNLNNFKVDFIVDG